MNGLTPAELQKLYDATVTVIEMLDDDPKTYRPSAHIPRDICNCGELETLCTTLVLLLKTTHPWIAPQLAGDVALRYFRDEH
jgi:hypothetical protein